MTNNLAMKRISELMNLTGRVALITGGAGHVGRAMSEALAEMGASIAVLDVAEEDCRKAAERLSDSYSVEALPLVVDLSNADAVRAAPGNVLDHFGRLDILIHCAAFVGTTQCPGWAVPFDQQSIEAWDMALRVNLTSAFVLAQQSRETLSQSGHGSIILVSSIYGMVGPDMRLYDDTDMANPAGYGASKGGLLQLTRYLATNLAPQIRVNAISPGGIWRGQPDAFHERYVCRTPVGRMATEEDLKGAAVYLASDMSAYVTGQNLVVDGGWTAW